MSFQDRYGQLGTYWTRVEIVWTAPRRVLVILGAAVSAFLVGQIAATILDGPGAIDWSSQRWLILLALFLWSAAGSLAYREVEENEFTLGDITDPTSWAATPLATFKVLSWALWAASPSSVADIFRAYLPTFGAILATAFFYLVALGAGVFLAI